jgi:hypothetical protein
MSEALRLAEESTNLAERRLESDGYEWSVDADVQLRETAAELRRLAPMEAEVSQLRADANTCGSGAGCCYQAAQNERLEAELQQAREERTALLVNEQNLQEELAALRASLGEPVAWYRIEEHEWPVYYESRCWDDLIPLYAIKDAMLSASPQAPDHTEDVLGMVAQPAEHALKPINDADFPAEDEAKLSPDPYTSFVYGARWAEHTHGIRHTQAPQPTQPDPWAEYLKEGETPFERFMRERADLVALLGLHEKTLAKVAQPNTDQQP